MSDLSALKNVGKATLKDLALLEITTVEALKNQNPNTLYAKLCALTAKKHDPCVWDVFAAIIHEANTGEKTPWWHWTKIRKEKGLNVATLTDVV